MRRLLAVVTVVFLAGCGGDKKEATASRDLSSLTTTTIDGRPAWLDTLGAPASVEEGVAIRATDGHTERVWVDKAGRMVYAQTCDIARLATTEGAYYGPGNLGSGPGFAYVCP